MRRIAIVGLFLTFLPLAAAAQTSGFVYALLDSLTDNQIYGFGVDPTTGALTALPGFRGAQAGPAEPRASLKRSPTIRHAIGSTPSIALHKRSACSR